MRNGLALSGADADRVLRQARAAQVFEQQNHFVFLILILQRAGRAAARGGTNCRVAATLELRDSFGQLRPAATAAAAAFEDA
jgi:hypothetical protein